MADKKYIKTKAKCIGYSIPMGYEQIVVDGIKKRGKPILKAVDCGESFDTQKDKATGKVSQPRCKSCRSKHNAIRRVQKIQKDCELLGNLAGANYSFLEDELESICETAENAVALATDKLRGQSTVNPSVFAL